jgi:ABC-type multidrug transport system permease subunit
LENYLYTIKDIIHMDWKNLFKPRWRNVLLGLGIAFVILIIYTMLFACFGGRVCPPDTIQYPYPGTCTFTDCMPEDQARNWFLLHYIPFYLMFIVVAYVLASFILYSTVRNKEKSS